MKAAIVIDTWKLAIFKKGLKKSGYTFTKGKGLTPDSLVLTVKYEDYQALDKLKPIIAKINTECATVALRNSGKLH